MSAAEDPEAKNPAYSTPGVYRYEEEVFPPQPAVGLETGVPAFLGYAKRKNGTTKAIKFPVLYHWEDFYRWYEDMPELKAKTYLPAAVRGFFQNDGQRCYVVPLNPEKTPEAALFDGLEATRRLEEVDLVCAPDSMRSLHKEAKPDPEQVRSLQKAVLEHCDQAGDRFAILDSLSGADSGQVTRQRQGLIGMNGALYYPWVRVAKDDRSDTGLVPPCGHIAGVYARTDARVGVHKAPANELLLGVVDLEMNLTSALQGPLNEIGINCLREIPGRGLRVWGARTLSGLPDWIYVNVRRLFITAGRWIHRNLADVSFEPNTESLWARIERDLTVYFSDLYRKGALKGETAQEAFYVKCDRETNPPHHRDLGIVVTEIGLSATVPNEFVVVRITHMASGVTIAANSEPGSA